MGPINKLKMSYFTFLTLLFSSSILILHIKLQIQVFNSYLPSLFTKCVSHANAFTVEKGVHGKVMASWVMT